MTCGGRSIWFQKNHPHTIYFDQRDVEYEQTFGSDPSARHIKVHPDVMGDFRDLPFPDNTFNLVVFDPPHIIQRTDSWITKGYGRYESKEEMMSSVVKGISEGMRVLKPRGVLIFKWADISMSVQEILSAVRLTPLFGHKSGKKSGTHWLCFMKEEAENDN